MTRQDVQCTPHRHTSRMRRCLVTIIQDSVRRRIEPLLSQKMEMQPKCIGAIFETTE